MLEIKKSASSNPNFWYRKNLTKKFTEAGGQHKLTIRPTLNFKIWFVKLLAINLIFVI